MQKTFEVTDNKTLCEKERKDIFHHFEDFTCYLEN